MRFSSPDKDVMISQLKNQVFEFEQNEKNFSSLQAKYRGMQNDFSLVSEEKIRLEYELKQRTELLNKQIAELRNDNDNLQSNLNEKLALNKRLYNDNNNLFRTLESRNAEIEALREQLADCDDSNSILKEEKSNLEKTVINLTDVKKSNEVTINKYLNEIDSCNKICEEQDGLIKNLNDEKSDLLGRIDELNFELKNTFGKLKSKEDALSFVQRQFEDSSKNISKLEIQLRELEQNLGRTKIELNNSNNSQSKERALRIESEKNGEKLEMIIKERTNEIKRLSNDLDGSRIMIEKLNSEKGRLLGEIERYKSHIVILTEQNQRVIFFNF